MWSFPAARFVCGSTTAPTTGFRSSGLPVTASVRETDFGWLFDIVVEPDPFTPSQSSAALDLHTDDPYRYTPSGMSILHCVEASAGDGHVGGATIVVDGFAVADAIAAEDSALQLIGGKASGSELNTTDESERRPQKGCGHDQDEDTSRKILVGSGEIDQRDENRNSTPDHERARDEPERSGQSLDELVHGVAPSSDKQCVT